LELTEEYFFAAGFFGLPALTDWALIGKAGSGFLWRPARIPVNLRSVTGWGLATIGLLKMLTKMVSIDPS